MIKHGYYDGFSIFYRGEIMLSHAYRTFDSWGNPVFVYVNEEHYQKVLAERKRIKGERGMLCLESDQQN